ncbi:MAG: phage holin family protein, partial [Chloroflexota bacterium]|nr:phage holin family protein [Chloroflexota bacterium]
IFGLVNSLVRPPIKLLTCPLIVVTLGLFTLVINTFMLWLAARLGNMLGVGFYYINGLRSAFLGALIISLVSWILGLLIPSG